MKTRLQKLIQLSAASEALIQFRYDDEDHLLRNSAIGAGAAGAGVAGGLYAAGRKPMNDLIGPRRVGMGGVLDTMRAGGARTGAYVGGVKSAIGGTVEGYKSRRVGAEAGLGLGKAAAAKGSIGNLLSKLKGLRFSRIDKIIALRSLAEDLVHL